MNENIELGQQMWKGLLLPFQQMAVDHGIATTAEKAQLWAGFLAGASGAMCADIGPDNTQAVLDQIKKSCAEVMRNELRVVKP